MIINTTFSIEDKVYTVEVENKPEYINCVECKGKGIIPTATGKSIGCDYCSRTGKQVKAFVAQHIVCKRIYTIGSVRFDSYDNENPVTYMCEETGVGSGTIWYEKDLFKTKSAAQARCNALNKGTINERDDN